MIHLYNLPESERYKAISEYNQNKLNKSSAYICRWFGFYRAYTGQYGLLILFWISLFFGIGVIRYFIDLFMVGSYVENYNEKLEIDIVSKYKSIE